MSPPENPWIRIDGTDVHIDAATISGIAPGERATRNLCDERPVLRLLERAPRLTVYLGGEPVARYLLEPIAQDPTLAGKFLHASIRILDNLALMMDGLVSLDERDAEAGAAVDGDGGRFVEGIRFQPLFIGAARGKNALTVGKGLFERGLHFSGSVTPGSVRACCICDRCGGSFSLEHFHTGFGQGWGAGQYFYCERGIHTAIVDPDRLPGCPYPLQETIDPARVAEAEAKLPPCAACGTAFRYLNPLRCPHCAAPYLDFERFPGMRPSEYYGCVVVGEAPQVVRLPDGER
jgi:hypothetical protein